MFFFKNLRLNLFDGEAGAGAAATGDANSTGSVSTQQSAGDNSNAGNSGADASASASNGNTNPAAGDRQSAGETQGNSDDLRKEFRELIRGKFKDIYAQETQSMVNRRFSETKKLEEFQRNTQPILDTLMQRYNVSDVSMLADALDNDMLYLSNAAEEAGMSVTQFRNFQRMQRENEALRREIETDRTRMKAQTAAQAWASEAEAMQERYPNFDLETELQNEEFKSLLRSHVPMEHAYKVLHMDEIMNNALTSTAAKTEKDVVDNIRANGMRPVENGTSGNSAFKSTVDYSKMSKSELMEIARKIKRG